MKTRKSRWIKWQRGQAMMEYWPTIPASIIIILAAAGLVQFITGGLLKSYGGLTFHKGGLECFFEEEESEEGPDEAELDCHTIQLVSNVYDEKTDRTTIAYKVTSGCDPSISHWMLGLPESVAANILSSSESYEYVTDPATGVTGLKFDRGYETARHFDGLMLIGNLYSPTNMDSRTVVITLAGAYTWSITEVAIKAGTQVYETVITAPVEVASDEPEEECEV